MAKKNLSQASFVTLGYGQVEPNHLSAQATRQIYAQLPAASDIEVLENGQFVKYDYLNGVCNFSGAGEWMLVFNEVKVYEDYEGDADFAMIKDNYGAYVYSPVNGSAITSFNPIDYSGAVKPANPYVVDSTANPMGVTTYGTPAYMSGVTFDKHDFNRPIQGSTMTPRVFKTNIGDIYTTNCVKLDLAAEAGDLLGKVLTPGATGILEEGEGDMKWQVIKVYDLADRQRAVKLMRIA